MAIDFSVINLEAIDINTNVSPDIFINQNCITFSKRVLEDLGYPQTVQYCVDAGHKVFAIRSCKGNEVKATPFSKPKTEQNGTLSCGNKNLHSVITSMIPDYLNHMRYKVTGESDIENHVIYFDLTTAKESSYRTGTAKAE